MTVLDEAAEMQPSNFAGQDTIHNETACQAPALMLKVNMQFMQRLCKHALLAEYWQPVLQTQLIIKCLV